MKRLLLYLSFVAALSACYNILHGIMPPDSGHWRNNPHADDIDFQIEADYAGIMSPGLPAAASHFSDDIGHISNSGFSCAGEGTRTLTSCDTRS